MITKAGFTLHSSGDIARTIAADPLDVVLRLQLPAPENSPLGLLALWSGDPVDDRAGMKGVINGIRNPGATWPRLPDVLDTLLTELEKGVPLSPQDIFGPLPTHLDPQGKPLALVHTLLSWLKSIPSEMADLRDSRLKAGWGTIYDLCVSVRAWALRWAAWARECVTSYRLAVVPMVEVLEGDRFRIHLTGQARDLELAGELAEFLSQLCMKRQACASRENKRRLVTEIPELKPFIQAVKSRASATSKGAQSRKSTNSKGEQTACYSLSSSVVCERSFLPSANRDGDKI